MSFAYPQEGPGAERAEGSSSRFSPASVWASWARTGAGKSYAAQPGGSVLRRDGGSIRLDGVDLRNLNLDDLRRNLGIVFQESFLFSNTVAANIAFGYPERRKRRSAAARLAAADEFIQELPHGYETVVGEYGSNLSGGQRQRLSIARALLLDPPLLLLDDAMAAVDPETEREIRQSLDSARQGRTTIVVANRISTLRHADQIIVLHRGRIVQHGTHAELMPARCALSSTGGTAICGPT